ncbi:L-serine ammonia-lyase, iron-sulfur-dependent, subunit alpha [Thalassospira marina]|uniref:L-serine ammonia-lyase n=1 Tax=Thalassospira marina TaxID=2048283 RepID=A0A2N3KG76_9PROT|nr:L-serine ammonia-lyase, iron-sulfur-dependent, subunit alpha [Thalassospira marina]PKR49568.1 serine ammonia-lyase [Thalassospira marina]
MQEISLLNSVVGPVMRGPSSSHCAAPYMMGRLARSLSTSQGEVIETADIRFDPRGSFAPVYQAQSSDENFAAGLAGASLTDPDFREILGRASAGEGFTFSVTITELQRNNHPNRVDMVISVRAKDGSLRQDVYQGASIGGGMFYIDRMNGEDVYLTGKTAVLYVYADDVKSVQNRIADLAATDNRLLGQDVMTVPAEGGIALERLEISLQRVPAPDVVRDIVALAGIKRVLVADAAQYPVCAGDDLFSTTQGVLDKVSSHNGSLAHTALALEAQRLGLSTEETRLLFIERAELMLRVVEEGFSAREQDSVMRFLTLKARKVRDANLPAGLGGAVLQDAIAGALSAMERDSNRGLVVAAPTAGSAGVVPGTLYGLVRHGIDIEGAADALQVMALIGAVFAARGTFAAECGGCSVETGASAAMAAGGVVQAFGGSAEQCFDAASMCLMNTLGLVCDPVGGDVEIPCHARNVAGVSHAYSSAMAVMAGFDAVLGFDELVDQTVKIGSMMHADLRCTARGGCAATKTAHKLVEQVTAGIPAATQTGIS